MQSSQNASLRWSLRKKKNVSGFVILKVTISYIQTETPYFHAFGPSTSQESVLRRREKHSPGAEARFTAWSVGPKAEALGYLDARAKQEEGESRDKGNGKSKSSAFGEG